MVETSASKALTNLPKLHGEGKPLSSNPIRLVLCIMHGLLYSQAALILGNWNDNMPQEPRRCIQQSHKK